MKTFENPNTKSFLEELEILMDKCNASFEVDYDYGEVTGIELFITDSKNPSELIDLPIEFDARSIERILKQYEKI